jgi:CheY-like chemotaxis protein
VRLVVIIDDDSYEMDYCRFYLELEGYKVELISNPIKAIDFIEKNVDSIAAIVLDNIMPTADEKTRHFLGVEQPRQAGIAVLEKINQIKKKMKKDVPVIMRSVVDDQALKDEATEMGVVAYLWKLDTGPALLTQEIRKHVKETS